MFAARASGNLGVGVRAGAISWGLPLAIIVLLGAFSASYHSMQTGRSLRALPGVFIVILTVALLFGGGGFIGVVVGGVVSFPGAWLGAWLGTWQARSERLATPALPQHSLTSTDRAAHDSLPATLDELAILANAPADGVVISPDWLKSLLMFLMMFSIAVVLAAMAASGENVVIGWLGALLTTLIAFLAPANMIFNRPLLRFSETGIDYKGAIRTGEGAMCPGTR
jgi:hypothetical protein